jgi:hypothetical protein
MAAHSHTAMFKFKGQMEINCSLIKQLKVLNPKVWDSEHLTVKLTETPQGPRPKAQGQGLKAQTNTKVNSESLSD